MNVCIAANVRFSWEGRPPRRPDRPRTRPPLGAVLPAASAVTRAHQKANTDQSQTPAIEFEDEFEDDFLYLVSQRVSARH